MPAFTLTRKRNQCATTSTTHSRAGATPSAALDQSSFALHSLREILKFLPLQHLQPAPCIGPAENRDASRRPTAVERFDIAGKHNAVRGASVLQVGQATGKSYSASGRKSANKPQRGQWYSYFGMLSL